VDYYLLTLYASLSGLAQSTTVAIGLPPVKSISCSPGKLTPGGTAMCSYTLAATAPVGGEILKITSSSPKLSVPATTGVTAGATAGTFAVTALAGFAGPVSVTLFVGGVASNTTISAAELERKPAGRDGSRTPITISPQQLSCFPKVAAAGANVTCEVQLTADSGDGSELLVWSTGRSVRVPEKIKSRPHQSTLSFQASIDPGAASQPVSISVAIGDAVPEQRIEERINVQAANAPVLSLPDRSL